MTISFEQVVTQVEVSRGDLTRWIRERWVLPIEQDGGYLFDEVDIARVRLIAELRDDLAVNDEAVPVILQLLDQVYELRRTLGELRQAIAQLPETARGQIDETLKAGEGG